MSNVLGPYDQAEWFVLGQLFRSLRHMKTTDSNFYDLAIKKETDLFNIIKRKEVA